MAAPRRAAKFAGTAYEVDVSAWALEQAHHLRAGSWARLDIAHLADEIEAVSRTERHALTSALRVILLHMLKWDHQPERRMRSWVSSIRTQRLAVAEQIEDSPSLASQVPQLLPRAYRRVVEAGSETGLDDAAFPKACPYDFDAIMDRAFAWPPEAEP
ncbi:DUF29 domain-containing protein [uncultured Methylobacterium sp.]|uniref:DUF29 domain-containing protein n=1 Tax=uncultured Methylobacterium sp. TaxID=157278 RepID=UPI0035C94F60